MGYSLASKKVSFKVILSSFYFTAVRFGTVDMHSKPMGSN